jgi:hypothetical protein
LVDKSVLGTSDTITEDFNSLPSVDDQFVFSNYFTGAYNLGNSQTLEILTNKMLGDLKLPPVIHLFSTT